MPPLGLILGNSAVSDVDRVSFHRAGRNVKFKLCVLHFAAIDVAGSLATSDAKRASAALVNLDCRQYFATFGT